MAPKTEFDLEGYKLPKPKDHNARPTNADSYAAAFDEAHFVGFLKQNLKFTQKGDVEFTIQVPQKWYQLVMPLATAFGKPLEFHISTLEKPVDNGPE